MASNAARSNRTVESPNAKYETLAPLWRVCRAVCGGERFVKELDATVDVTSFTNLLIPFSPTMTQAQYNFYRAEAELPGICSEFSRMLVGGLLRKAPTVSIKGVTAEAVDWILNDFGQDGKSLAGVLSDLLWEEIQTSRVWIYVDHPVSPRDPTPEQVAKMKPYPVIWPAENVINFGVGNDDAGNSVLKFVVVRALEEMQDPENPYHPKLVDTVRVHTVTDGIYQILVYRAKAEEQNVPVVNAKLVNSKTGANGAYELDVESSIKSILFNDEPLTYIPAWPLNGSIEPSEPILTSLITKELSVYNKMSRRNHLLYGAATYTPILFTDMADARFEETVNKGLGSWLKLGMNDKAEVLETPTAALADMDRAVAAGIEEMARLGVRMLAPESEQSGVALEIRNAAQTARLGMLNTSVSAVIRQVIAFMLNWRYDLKLHASDVEFQLSEDFNPTPIGADWLRLATEWYEKGLMPRSIWLTLLKRNEMLEPGYDDKEGIKEINENRELITPPVDDMGFAGKGKDKLDSLK